MAKKLHHDADTHYIVMQMKFHREEIFTTSRWKNRAVATHLKTDNNAEKNIFLGCLNSYIQQNTIYAVL